jgi:four helix bundle protein
MESKQHNLYPLNEELDLLKVAEFSEKIYSYDDRLIRFAGEVKLWYRAVKKTDDLKYYGHQLLRASGSAALNFGEAQGTITTKDFIFKVGIALKELQECRVNLRVMVYGEDIPELSAMLDEVIELMAISGRMIKNAQARL